MCVLSGSLLVISTECMHYHLPLLFVLVVFIFISIIIITIIMIIIITIIIRINNSSIFSPIKQKEKTKLIALPTMSKQLA